MRSTSCADRKWNGCLIGELGMKTRRNRIRIPAHILWILILRVVELTMCFTRQAFWDCRIHVDFIHAKLMFSNESSCSNMASHITVVDDAITQPMDQKSMQKRPYLLFHSQTLVSMRRIWPSSIVWLCDWCSRRSRSCGLDDLVSAQPYVLPAEYQYEYLITRQISMTSRQPTIVMFFSPNWYRISLSVSLVPTHGFEIWTHHIKGFFCRVPVAWCSVVHSNWARHIQQIF